MPKLHPAVKAIREVARTFSAAHECGTCFASDIKHDERAIASYPDQPSVTDVGKITAEDARMWGRAAHEMGITLERAIQDISECGCPASLLHHVRDTYAFAKLQALHREA